MTKIPPVENLPGGHLYEGECVDVMNALPSGAARLIIADPPYYNVQTATTWDTAWVSPEDYLQWSIRWVEAARRLLAPDGLLYIFGQPGKREHVFVHLISLLAKAMSFHDLIAWDRVVGYNERSDSFTPQFEMILALRHPGCDKPYFDKDAVRVPYDEKTIATYLKDKRYKDPVAREKHLRSGRYATNILRVPSLKGISKEKAGHPSQKPIALIDMLVRCSSAPGDTVLDPFLGSGTTALAAHQAGRKWIGIEKNPGYNAITRARFAAGPSGATAPLL